MIDVEQAQSRIADRSEARAPAEVPLDECCGLILARDVASDVDSPPHDKALMDGYAVVSTDLASGPADLVVLEEVTAGDTPTRTVKAGQATRIMTGAPIPAGADAVVMVEHTELLDTDEARVRIQESGVRRGQNMMPQGTSLRCGETVLEAGRALRPIEVGLLAEVGQRAVWAIPRPRVAVLATGNELVPHRELPAAGQIRNSNGPLICSLVTQAGGQPIDLGIGRDVESELRQRIERGLEQDVLVLSGGVSAGVLDLVPAVLAGLGVKEVFHKVQLKPGKPLWFGTLKVGRYEKLVFGLPGNPVSSFVCFELFVRPCIAALAGRAPRASIITARLSREHPQRGNRPTYWPAKLDDQRRIVTPLDWHGSADLRTLTDADCLVLFPAGERIFAENDDVQVQML